MKIKVIDPMVISPSTLPDAQRTKDYNQKLTVTGGVPPYSWEIIDGALPTSIQGLQNNSEFLLQGNVNAVNNDYFFTVKVTDANGNSVQQ